MEVNMIESNLNPLLTKGKLFFVFILIIQKAIAKNYKAKILILDAEANEIIIPTDAGKATNKINKILIKHNQAYTIYEEN